MKGKYAGFSAKCGMFFQEPHVPNVVPSVASLPDFKQVCLIILPSVESFLKSMTTVFSAKWGTY